jgi:CO/xanthine dehydrogenase FAD-binding subunit
MTAIVVPASSAAARSTFVKLGARRYLVISIAMAAVTLDFDGQGRVAHAAIAVGACSPIAQRIPALEARLLGRPRSAELAELVHQQDFAVLSPISDVRGTAEYRLDAVPALVRRGVAALAHERR